MIGVDPRGIDRFIDWADYMYPDLEQFGQFDDWKDWAMRFIQTLNSGGSGS